MLKHLAIEGLPLHLSYQYASTYILLSTMIPYRSISPKAQRKSCARALLINTLRKINSGRQARHSHTYVTCI